MADLFEKLLKVGAYSLGKTLAKSGVEYLKNLENEDEDIKNLPSNCLKKWIRNFRSSPAGVHIIIGKQRSGKTALCYTLAQLTGRIPIYIITTASKFLSGAKPISTIDEVPRNSVCIVDDASYFYSSMKKAGDSNYDALRELIIFAEKQNICFLFNTHDTTLLNKHVLGQCKSIFFKQPNLFGVETERKMIKVLLDNIQKQFNQIPVPQREKWFYLYSSDCKAWGKNSLPKDWSNQVSTSLGDVTDAKYEVIEDNDNKKPDDTDIIAELKRKDKETKNKKLLIKHGYCPECKSKDTRQFESYSKCLKCGTEWTT